MRWMEFFVFMYSMNLHTSLWGKYCFKFHSTDGETGEHEVQQLAQGYLASKQQNWDFNHKVWLLIMYSRPLYYTAALSFAVTVTIGLLLSFIDKKPRCRGICCVPLIVWNPLQVPCCPDPVRVLLTPRLRSCKGFLSLPPTSPFPTHPSNWCIMSFKNLHWLLLVCGIIFKSVKLVWLFVICLLYLLQTYLWLFKI